jgi:hypothetical protein
MTVPAPDARRRMDAVLRAAVTGVLKPQGFRESALTWRRALPEVLQIVDAQVSRWVDRTNRKFTLNVGIAVPDVRALDRLRAMGSWTDPSPPTPQEP